MNQQMKQDWLEALRSGEYKQCKGKLHCDNDKFCCLGVLIDATQDLWWEKLDLVKGMNEIWSAYGQRTNSTFLLDYDYIDTWMDHDIKTTLVNMNDAGASFAEIADWIETEL